MVFKNTGMAFVQSATHGLRHHLAPSQLPLSLLPIDAVPVIDSGSTSMLLSLDVKDAVVSALPAPSASIFWAGFFGLVIIGLLNPEKSGFVLNPLRLFNGGSLPLEGAKEFDMSRFDYNSLQKFRHQFGYIASFFLIIAGFLGGYSGMLADEPALQDYARSAVMSLGLGAPPTHYLFNKSRYDNGKQLTKTFGLWLCVAGQVLFSVLTQLWLQQVQVALPQDFQVELLTVSVYGLYASFLVLNGIRVLSYLQGGSEYFFEPQVDQTITEGGK